LSSVARGRVRSAPLGLAHAHEAPEDLMEKRAILAAVLMAGLLMLYQVLFVKAPDPVPPTAERREAAPAAIPVQESARGTKVSTAVAPVPRTEVAAVPDRTAGVESPLYRAIVDSRGGRFDDWALH